MEFLTLLIVFFVISKLGELLRGGTRPPPGQLPRRPQPGSRLPQQRQSPAGEAEPTASSRETAAEMIPEELWELITGQPRPRPVPPPPPETHTPSPRPTVPARRSKAPGRSWEAHLEDESAEPEAYRDEDAEVVETLRAQTRDVQAEIDAARRRHEGIRAEREYAVQVVSLETEPPSDRVRHRRFHEKLEATQTVAEVPTSLAAGLGLGTPRDIRRAFVMHEVLGPPKALEGEPDGR